MLLFMLVGCKEKVIEDFEYSNKATYTEAEGNITNYYPTITINKDAWKDMKVDSRYCKTEQRVIGGNVCYRCEDISIAVLPSILEPGDWVCPK